MRENLVVFFTLNTVSVPLESFNLRGGRAGGKARWREHARTRRRADAAWRRALTRAGAAAAPGGIVCSR